MKTSWKIKLNSEVNSNFLLQKALLISTQITRACLLSGRNIIKIPEKYIDIINVTEFEKHFDVIFEKEIDNVFIYRSNVFDFKYFHQKKNDEIIGAGIKFIGDLFDGEELIKPERMCGEIEILKQIKNSFELREWNYYFEVGDLVIFAGDIPLNYEITNTHKDSFYEKINLENYENKVGVVERCWSDLHTFASGSVYMVEVNFDGKIVTNFAQLFLKQNAD